MVSFGVFINLTQKENVCCPNIIFEDNISNHINIIQKNCGSTQIVHKYNNNIDWFVFRSFIEDNKQQFAYIPINECFNKDVNYRDWSS